MSFDFFSKIKPRNGRNENIFLTFKKQFSVAITDVIVNIIVTTRKPYVKKWNLQGLVSAAPQK